MNAPFPHCDPYVLHAPGKCEYCDLYPAKQEERARTDSNFTGGADRTKAPCPSTWRRTSEQVERWPGNRAKPKP